MLWYAVPQKNPKRHPWFNWKSCIGVFFCWSSSESKNIETKVESKTYSLSNLYSLGIWLQKLKNKVSKIWDEFFKNFFKNIENRVSKIHQNYRCLLLQIGIHLVHPFVQHLLDEPRAQHLPLHGADGLLREGRYDDSTNQPTNQPTRQTNKQTNNSLEGQTSCKLLKKFIKILEMTK